MLFEVPENPSKNDAVLYKIKNDLLVRKERLPTFIAKASDLDGDGVLEYAGAWGYSEEFDEKGIRYRTYDPIIYYKLTANGIKLDTLLTKKRNAMIYGKLIINRSDGTASVRLSSGVNERFSKEYDRIKANAKK